MEKISVFAVVLASLFCSCVELNYENHIVDRTLIVLQVGDSVSVHTHKRALITDSITRNENINAHCFKILKIEPHEISICAIAPGYDKLRVDFDDTKSKLGYGSVQIDVQTYE